MDDQEQNRRIKIFKKITTLDKKKCRWFLESTKWDINIALSMFFDGKGFESSSSLHDVLNEVSDAPSSSTSSSTVPQLSSRRLSQLSRLAIIDSMLAPFSGSEDEDGNASSKPKTEHENSLERAASEVIGVVPKEGDLVPTNVLKISVDETAARAKVPLIPNAPTTALKIRLIDGTKLIAKFNHTHTVGDVRHYINAATSSFALDSFELHASYPPKILKDNNQTLLEAGLMNSMIFQRDD